MAQVRVRYVDGTEVSATPEAWRHLRGDGVDFVEWNGERFEGGSFYWLTRVDGEWQAGMVAWQDIPDMALDEVKLGHWWPTDADGVVYRYKGVG